MSNPIRIAGWFGVAMICVAWACVALFLAQGWQNYVWETSCREGHALFAIGQALVTAIGIAIAIYAAGRHRPRMLAITAACFVAWLLTLLAYPETRDLAFAACG